MLNDTRTRENSLLQGYNMMLYFAGTMIMYEPSEECIIDFWNQGILKNLPVCSSNPVYLRAASQLKESCTDRLSTTNAMAEDYYRLFSRKEMPFAPLNESFYSNNYTGNSNVTEFYDSYGWTTDLRKEMNDDHLGVELLFLTKLIEKFTELDDDACNREMKNEIKRFIENHLLSWVPEWHKKVQHNSLTLSYKGISSLIYASIEDLYNIFSDKKRGETTHHILKN